MGRRGVAPKPTALRLLDGDRADRFPSSEPIPRDELPICPDDVSPEVRRVWDYTVGHLDAMQIAKACDRDSLVCYCEAVVNHRKASSVLAKSPILIKGALGGLVRNPALAVQRDAAYTVRHFAQEFGLTPSARSRVEAKTTESGDSGNPFAGTG
jgi:P27 family predicted phage terminase small subunit